MTIPNIYFFLLAVNKTVLWSGTIRDKYILQDTAVITF